MQCLSKFQNQSVFHGIDQQVHGSQGGGHFRRAVEERSIWRLLRNSYIPDDWYSMKINPQSELERGGGLNFNGIPV